MIDPLERARSLQFEDPPIIALAEGEDRRVWEAAEWAAKEGFCHPVVVTEEEVHFDAGILDLEVLRPSSLTDRSSMVEPVARRLESIGRDPGQAEALLEDRLHFTCGLVAAGHVDGAVMGAASTTADTVRACLRTLGPHPGLHTVSSCFLMIFPGDRGLIYSDCGVVPEPDAETLAEIAIAAAESCRALLSAEPRVALLAFSTKGSAEHSSLHKIHEACRLLAERQVDFEFDGELQADAALVADVAERKAPQSPVAGRANVLVFPDLNAGNIAYKLTERLAGARALGPLFQGLSRPVNDVSRGCSARDLLEVMALTTLEVVAHEDWEAKERS